MLYIHNIMFDINNLLFELDNILLIQSNKNGEKK